MTDEWDDFDPDQYLHHYYDTPLCEDLMWVAHLTDFVKELAPSGRALEIGPGPAVLNLLLSSLCSASIDVCERGSRNRDYLARTLSAGLLPQLWQPFVEVIDRRLSPPRPDLTNLRGLASIVQFTEAHDFRVLPPGTYDFVSMQFVAESATATMAEFDLATAAAVRLARPGGKFLFSFMAGFEAGYSFGGDSVFPSVSIERNDVRRALRGAGDAPEIVFIPRIASQDRSGPYDGVIVASGVRSDRDGR